MCAEFFRDDTGLLLAINNYRDEFRMIDLGKNRNFVSAPAARGLVVLTDKKSSSAEDVYGGSGRSGEIEHEKNTLGAIGGSEF